MAENENDQIMAADQVDDDAREINQEGDGDGHHSPPPPGEQLLNQGLAVDAPPPAAPPPVREETPEAINPQIQIRQPPQAGGHAPGRPNNEQRRDPLPVPPLRARRNMENRRGPDPHLLEVHAIAEARRVQRRVERATADEGMVEAYDQMRNQNQALMRFLESLPIAAGARQLWNELKTANEMSDAALRGTRKKLTDLNARKKGVMEQTPFCTLPDFGDVIELPHAREYRLEEFKGDREQCLRNPWLCLDWVQRALDHVEHFKLTETTAIMFFRRHVTQDAGHTVRAAIEDRKSLRELVVALETNYGGLVHPDMALEKCRRANRQEKESIQAFGARIRNMAQMAMRDRPIAQRRADTLSLARDSFMAALAPNLKNILRMKVDDRMRRGDAAPAFADLVDEAHNLELERIATKAVYETRREHSERVHLVQQADAWEHWCDATARVEEPKLSDMTALRVSEWERRKAVNAAAVNAAAANAAAAKSAAATAATMTQVAANAVAASPAFAAHAAPPALPAAHAGGQGRPTAAAPAIARRIVGEGGSAEGYIEVGEVSDGTSQIFVEDACGSGGTILLVNQNGGPPRQMRLDWKSLGVTSDECVKCGLEGHRAFGEGNTKCPLRAHKIEQKPCERCGKGGHLPEVCLRSLDLMKAAKNA